MTADTVTSHKDPIGERFGKTWCILPWIHAATLTDGSTQLCCVAEGVSPVNLNKQTLTDYWNSSYVKSARQSMLKDKNFEACRRCYEEEKNGYRSHRMIENKNWHDILGSEKIDQIVQATQPDGQLPLDMMAIDLRLGNTCNLQCIMCQPRESSKWNQLASKIYETVNDSSLKSEWNYKRKITIENYEWYKNDNFWTALKSTIPHLREIIIAGGEPMLIKQHLAFLKEAATNHDVSKIHLRYHTNLMEFPIDMVPYWEKFQKVEFFASIDGMGDVANYIRHPSKWDVIEKNIRIIDELPKNIWLRFLFSVQAMNIALVPQFIRWVRDQKFKKAEVFPHTQMFIHPGLVMWPEYLNPKVLPSHVKANVTTAFLKLKAERPEEPFDKFDGIVSFMNSEDWSAKLPRTFEYLNALDKHRGTNYRRVLDWNAF